MPRDIRQECLDTIREKRQELILPILKSGSGTIFLLMLQEYLERKETKETCYTCGHAKTKAETRLIRICPPPPPNGGRST